MRGQSAFEEVPLKVIPSNPSIHAGYRDSGLSAVAQQHEAHPLFKVAFRSTIESLLGADPVNALNSSLDIGNLQVDPATGWVDADATRSFVADGIAFGTGVQLDITIEPEQGCEDTPFGWRKTRTFGAVDNSGVWTLGLTLDRYAQLLESSEESLSLTGSTKAELSEIKILFKLSWDNQYIDDADSGQQPPGGPTDEPNSDPQPSP